MATNVPGTGPSSRPDDEGTPVETETTPVVMPTAAGGVAVYDQDGDVTVNPSVRPSPSSSPSMMSSSPPAEVRSSGSTLTWIIGAVVLIVLVYFLWQWLF